MAILESRIKTGASWVGESLDLFKQAPRQALLLALSYFGIFLFIPSMPGLQVFAFITILMWPAFIVVAMRFYRNVALKKEENLAATKLLIQPKVKDLLALGLVSLFYFLIVSMLLSDELQAFAQLMDQSQQPQLTEQEMIQALSQTMMPLLIKLTLLFVPLMMAVWFAPMLIVFNDYSVVKALKSSIAGSLQYMVAMTVAWLLLSVGVVMLMLTASLFSGLLALIHVGFAQSLMTMVIFGCILISIALTLAFQYVSYRDIFRAA